MSQLCCCVTVTAASGRSFALTCSVSVSRPLLPQETRTSSESIISVPASSTSGSPSRVIYVSWTLSMATGAAGPGATTEGALGPGVVAEPARRAWCPRQALVPPTLPGGWCRLQDAGSESPFPVGGGGPGHSPGRWRQGHSQALTAAVDGGKVASPHAQRRAGLNESARHTWGQAGGSTS